MANATYAPATNHIICYEDEDTGGVSGVQASGSQACSGSPVTISVDDGRVTGLDVSFSPKGYVCAVILWCFFVPESLPGFPLLIFPSLFSLSLSSDRQTHIHCHQPRRRRRKVLLWSWWRHSRQRAEVWDMPCRCRVRLQSVQRCRSPSPHLCADQRSHLFHHRGGHLL